MVGSGGHAMMPFEGLDILSWLLLRRPQIVQVRYWVDKTTDLHTLAAAVMWAALVPPSCNTHSRNRPSTRPAVTSCSTSTKPTCTHQRTRSPHNAAGSRCLVATLHATSKQLDALATFLCLPAPRQLFSSPVAQNTPARREQALGPPANAKDMVAKLRAHRNMLGFSPPAHCSHKAL
jgi:hypothetical protein